MPWSTIRNAVFILIGALLFCYVIYMIMKTPSKVRMKFSPKIGRRERVERARPEFKPAAAKAKPAKSIWERRV